MIVGLPAEYLNSCRPTTIITSNTVAANTAMTENQTIMNVDTTNFLLGIPFAADSSLWRAFLERGMILIGYLKEYR
jgi:hypothetical protein